jgi:hypothetical protein
MRFPVISAQPSNPEILAGDSNVVWTRRKTGVGWARVKKAAQGAGEYVCVPYTDLSSRMYTPMEVTK